MDCWDSLQSCLFPNDKSVHSSLHWAASGQAPATVCFLVLVAQGRDTSATKGITMLFHFFDIFLFVCYGSVWGFDQGPVWVTTGFKCFPDLFLSFFFPLCPCGDVLSLVGFWQPPACAPVSGDNLKYFEEQFGGEHTLNADTFSQQLSMMNSKAKKQHSEFGMVCNHFGVVRIAFWGRSWKKLVWRPTLTELYTTYCASLCVCACECCKQNRDPALKALQHNAIKTSSGYN